MLAAMLDPRWLVAVILVGPLLALVSVNFSVMISSRVNDPRVAEQLTALLIMPLLAVFFGQMAGLFVLNRNLILLGCAVSAADRRDLDLSLHADFRAGDDLDALEVSDLMTDCLSGSVFCRSRKQPG